MIALNVYVVTSKETPAFLKWDAMSYIFANGCSSGSGTDSGEICYNSITTKEAIQIFYCGECKWVNGANTLLSGIQHVHHNYINLSLFKNSSFF